LKLGGVMSKRKRMRKGKPKNIGAFEWSSEWTIFWVVGGFLVTYFAFVPLESHRLHLLFTFLGGPAGYTIGIFVENWLSGIIRFVRRRPKRIDSKQDWKR